MPAKRGDCFTDEHGVGEALKRMVAKPLRDADAVRTKYHEAVVKITHDSGKLGFENFVQVGHDFVFIHHAPPSNSRRESTFASRGAQYVFASFVGECIIVPVRQARDGTRRETDLPR